MILLHGWPGSILEFLPMLELFKAKYPADKLPYHFIVPSLPGYTLSEMPLLTQDISQIDVARIMDVLMKKIGFGDAYVAQGGDVGSRVARALGVYHAGCKGRKDIVDHLMYKWANMSAAVHRMTDQVSLPKFFMFQDDLLRFSTVYSQLLLDESTSLSQGQLNPVRG